MQKDIRRLRIRFVIVVTLIVTVVMGCIFGVICSVLQNTIELTFLPSFTKRAMIRTLRLNATWICVIGIFLFTVIGAIASKWIVKPVEKTWKEQKQFVSDASHELKTPLTVITTNAEMLEQNDLSIDDRQKYTNNIVTVSHQMRDLVEDLLNLARLEKGEEAGFERVNLSEKYHEDLLQFEAVMFELGLNLKEEISPDIYINGSEQRLTQLLVILLDNAAKYSKKGDVTVNLSQQGKYAVLTVSNPSESFTQEQLENIFKRFYRGDESHNAKGSFGLGLSIARSICENHAGRIHAEYKDGLIKFIANLPTA